MEILYISIVIVLKSRIHALFMWPWTGRPTYFGNKQQKKQEIEKVVSVDADLIVCKSPVCHADIIKTIIERFPIEMSEALKLLHYRDRCSCHYLMSLFYFFIGREGKFESLIIYWIIILPGSTAGPNALFDSFSTARKNEEIIRLFGERGGDKIKNSELQMIQGLRQQTDNIKQQTTLPLTMGPGRLWILGSKKAAKQHCFWLRRSCGALGPDSSFLGPTLPLCQPESLCSPGIVYCWGSSSTHRGCTSSSVPTYTVCVCMCVLSADLSRDPTNSWATNKHTAATTESSRCSQLNQEHRWLPSSLHPNGIALAGKLPVTHYTAPQVHTSKNYSQNILYLVLC